MAINKKSRSAVYKVISIAIFSILTVALWVFYAVVFYVGLYLINKFLMYQNIQPNHYQVFFYSFLIAVFFAIVQSVKMYRGGRNKFLKTGKL